MTCEGGGKSVCVCNVYILRGRRTRRSGRESNTFSRDIAKVEAAHISLCVRESRPEVEVVVVEEEEEENEVHQ